MSALPVAINNACIRFLLPDFDGPMDVQTTPPEELLTQAEGLRLAFLRERFKVDELAETLVALANTRGGAVIIGVSGKVRPRPEGLNDIDATREAVLQAALACSPPLVLPLPQAVNFGEVTLLLVMVPPGLPHVYSLRGAYFQREGPTNQPLTLDALRRLLRDRDDASWDRLAPDDATLADLDMSKIQVYVERVGLAAENDPHRLLYQRGCLARGADGGYRPTHAGLLLFGRDDDLERRFPQAEIVLVHYQGIERADEFEREDIRAPLVEAARRAERWLNEHMRKGSRMVGLERQDWTQFPLAAVRETLINALAHRDYAIRGEGIRVALFADRLECYSPGRLPGHVTLENLIEERFSRNEAIVQTLADWGLIERLGYGIDRMVHQMDIAGLPPPVFRETAAGFLVTLYGQSFPTGDAVSLDTSEWLRQGLNERQIAALLRLTEHQRITNRDLQELAPDVSAETIRRDLADLVERGLLLKVGEKRATYYILK